jgi:hypothetical protein
MNLPEAAIGSVIAAAIAATITVITLLTKDYWFPILTEKRTVKTKRKSTFEKYANPIVLSSISLLYRMKEIFHRGHFLSDSAPKNFYNDYKYTSTVYRLLVLMGWIRASKIELSHIEVEKNDDYKLIEKALFNFEKSLADGEHVERSIVEQLTDIWRLNIDKVSDEVLGRLGTEIENTVDKFCFNENVEIAQMLSYEAQKELAKTICDLICLKIKHSKIDVEIINEHLKTSIKEMSRVESWIFRDWQSAFGDMMIVKSIGQERKYDVIGFKEFEQLYHSDDPENRKWINRIDRLFKNLNVEVDDRFDSRTLQLKNVYEATYMLLEVYSKVMKNKIDLSSEALKELKRL